MAKEQRFLFDDSDFIRNTLETERTEISKEMEATMSAIEKKQEKLGELEGRKANLDKAIQAIQAQDKKIKKEEGAST